MRGWPSNHNRLIQQGTFESSHTIARDPSHGGLQWGVTWYSHLLSQRSVHYGAGLCEQTHRGSPSFMTPIDRCLAAAAMLAFVACASITITAQQPDPAKPVVTAPAQVLRARRQRPPHRATSCFDMGKIVVVGSVEGRPGVGGAVVTRDQIWTLRSEVARSRREHRARRRQHLRLERPPQRERHLRARVRPLAGAAERRRRAHLSAGGQSARLQPLSHRRRRRGADSEGLRVGARRPGRDGRRHQSRDAEAGEGRSRRKAASGPAGAAMPKGGTATR